MPTLDLLMVTPNNIRKILEELAEENAEVVIKFGDKEHLVNILAFYVGERNNLALGTGSNTEHLVHYDPIKNKFFYVESVEDKNAPKPSKDSQIKQISKDIITNIPVSIYLVHH